MEFTFPKSEKLCSKILIDHVFESGEKLYAYPFKVLYKFESLPFKVPFQFVVTVSKKRFRRANKRNLLKRRTREALRMNKENLGNILSERNLQLAVVILYNSNKPEPFQSIDNGIKTIFDNLVSIVSKSGKSLI